MLKQVADDVLVHRSELLQNNTVVVRGGSGVLVVVPGHGSVGRDDDVRARIDQDRAYVLALRDARISAGPRIGPSAKPGWE
ncbi:hypothetical protein [Amycolatopsis orientalis]|uniref:hypothetical protein n=1 Tax=Amycolatopsis orientalis TaxID=31958 RepID=UPI00042A5C48|nr:hypothetical protein [Amycolatopsis orientalis]